MCIHIRKTLNPSAEEWRPAPLPPPPQAVVVTHQLFRLPHQLPFHHHPHFHFNLHSRPVYDRSSFYTAEKPLEMEMEMEMEGPRSVDKTPNTSTTLYFFKKRIGRRPVLPPRLRRCVGVARTQPPPPQPRQEWRPRKPHSHGGASRPRRPTYPDLSHSSPTTVMIKNIPNQLRRDFMLNFLDGYCKSYSLAYDFLYLPMDFRKKNNLGYAFVNFTTSAGAKKFKNVVDNFKWGGVIHTPDQTTITSKKICEITWGRIQGKEALVKRFRNSNFKCDRIDFLPVVFDPPRDGSDHDPAPPVVIGALQRRMCD